MALTTAPAGVKPTRMTIGTYVLILENGVSLTEHAATIYKALVEGQTNITALTFLGLNEPTIRSVLAALINHELVEKKRDTWLPKLKVVSVGGLRAFSLPVPKASPWP